MMRSAPICFAARTPIRPTAPSPTTTTVEPGWTRAASAAYQPVPSTSEIASRLGIRSSTGVRRGDQRAVGQRHARVGRLRAGHELALLAGGLKAEPAMRTGVVGEAERADDELAGLDRLHLAADLDDHAAVFMAHVHGAVDIGCSPRYGQRSEPQMQVADSLMMASVGFWIFGSATSSKRRRRGREGRWRAWLFSFCWESGE